MVPGAVFAQSTDPGASAFIQKLGDQTIATFADKSLSREQAVERFRALLHTGFDVPYIGRWVLGRYWNQASPAEQAEYQKLFERLIVDTYANRFVDYSGQTFKIAGTRPEAGDDTTVTTQIIRPDGPPINADWRVRKAGSGYKIIDVAVEGVSMGLTQRQEFASVIQGGGGQVAALIQALRQKVGRS
ncbi:phospholipid transport system substrate-binding protein [Azospirillum fermentarium]|uniref:MlaC/ttg2D family ABC transporter substrate-binding protein n=1 Tax=Azospirillum fermentarium TaxID=1233114 RepID=UPI0022260215|nr:ABC transporter substrate-binding protein [Azospirillum fermentarium]MCW2246838.1 phospholipid transport system substrate-binding protein [Azospirillum fermentarium]